MKSCSSTHSLSLSTLLLLYSAITMYENGCQAAAGRTYSKWSEWSTCPSICQLYCDKRTCVISRAKTCQRPRICQQTRRSESQPCGKCDTTTWYKQSTPANSLITAQLNEGIPPTVSGNRQTNTNNQLRQKTLSLVQLKNQCLHDSHFSAWSSWSPCVPGCRRVRYRHCLTILCKGRVENRDDPAITEEQWCIPDDSEAAKPCGKQVAFLHLYKGRDEGMEPEKCEEKLLKEKRKQQRKEARKDRERAGQEDKLPKGEVLDLGVSCGVRTSRPSLRIVGGRSAQSGEWPWQVAIMINTATEGTDFPFDHQQVETHEEDPQYVQYCGGTLVHEQWVLTAAHCVIDKETGLRKANMVVMVGETDMKVMRDSTNKWHKQIHQIKKVIAHRRFEWASVNNDIALVKLDKPVSQSPMISYSCVPNEDFIAKAGTGCIVLGWGKNAKYSHRRASRRLKQAKVPLVKRKTCKDAFNFTITKNQMCAGYKDGRSDSCDGDSGGPLLCLSDTQAGQRWVIYGITSFGPNDGCGIAGKYGVYTKVTNYSEWIRYAVQNDEEMPKARQRAVRYNRRRKRKKNRRKRRQKGARQEVKRAHHPPTTTSSAADQYNYYNILQFLTPVI